MCEMYRGWRFPLCCSGGGLHVKRAATRGVCVFGPTRRHTAEELSARRVHALDDEQIALHPLERLVGQPRAFQRGQLLKKLHVRKVQGLGGGVPTSVSHRCGRLRSLSQTRRVRWREEERREFAVDSVPAHTVVNVSVARGVLTPAVRGLESLEGGAIPAGLVRQLIRVKHTPAEEGWKMVRGGEG